jgi:serine/threonine protein kinase
VYIYGMSFTSLFLTPDLLLYNNRVFGVADAAAKVGEEDLWYLIEEFAEQGDLSTFIMKDFYTPAMFAKTTMELIEAIRFMHSHLICHLDLKLENVLLKGKSYTVKVADFGTSKHRRKNQDGSLSDEPASEEEQVAGTICYMPPETFEEPHKKEKLPSEFAWDCYSLAIMLWAMWERKLPWAGMGVCQVFNNVTKGRRPKFSSGTLPPAPSPELRLLVTSMWNKHPENRPEIEDIVQIFAADVAPPLKFFVKTDDWHGKHTDSHRDSLACFHFDGAGGVSKAIVRVAECPPIMDEAPPPIPEEALEYI